jgi:Ni/Co efflux regulator RcnB
MTMIGKSRVIGTTRTATDCPQHESRLQEGAVLDRDMRSRIHPLPADSYRHLPPPPRGYRYVFIGGDACLIDSGYRVHDVIHFELSF